MSLSKIAKKHFSQNFLIDNNIKNRICDAAQVVPDDTILEIGPGLGALTEKMLASGATVYAIEKDQALLPHLTTLNNGNLHLINADFLKYDLSSLPAITKVISNIPYNISSPIIERLIAYHHICQTIFLTTQFEFAQRLISPHGTKTYGALSCFIQYYADAEILFKISQNCFRPAPKVMSCFLKIFFRPPRDKADNEKLLFQITQTAFQQRRKKLFNALNVVLPKEKLKEVFLKLNIKEGSRPEELSLENYVCLANHINKIL